MKTRLTGLLLVATLLSGCSSSPDSMVDLDAIGANGLLTPSAILHRYVNALGGERLIRSHTSTSLHGQFTLTAFGLAGDITILTAAPNKTVQRINIPGIGQIASGFDGTTGWSMDPIQGNSLVTGTALDSLIERSDYYLPLTLLDALEGAETLEVIQVDGEDAYKVQVMSATSGATFLAFSTTTGLLLQTESVVPSVAGQIQVTQVLGNYKNYGGYMLATTVRVNQAGQDVSIAISEASFDAVDPAEFALPSEIQAMLR